MRVAIWSWILTGMLCVLVTGCIPSEPTEPASDQPSVEGLQLPVEDPVVEVPQQEAPPPPPGVGRVRTDLQARVNAGAQVRSREAGGFEVKGALGTVSGSKLEGTILPQEDGGWLFDATFTFMTGGYSVGEPFASFLGTKVFGGPQAVDGPSSNVMIISIPVTTPSPDAVVTKAITTEPIRMELDAPEDTDFSVVFISGS